MYLPVLMRNRQGANITQRMVGCLVDSAVVDTAAFAEGRLVFQVQGSTHRVAVSGSNRRLVL